MLLVQGHDELIGALQLTQHRCAISWPSSGIDHSFAQRAGKRLQDRATQEELADFRRLTIHNLCSKIVYQNMRAAPDMRQQELWVPILAHGNRRHL